MTLLKGNCLETLKTLETASVDSIVTDPPYELGFMGKSWDNSGIAYNQDLWAECLRVLKPGGHLLAFSGSRTYHRMVVAIEDSGFEIRDQIMWIYGSGFPKSLDVSKAIDKNNGEPNRLLKFTNWMRTTGLKAKELDEATGTNMGGHYLSTASQPAIPTVALWAKIRPLIAEVPEWVDELVDRIEAERKVVGTREVPVGHAFAGEVYGGDSSNKEVNVTLASTPEAQQWQGWGTALKPAHEPIVVARKPLIGTVANNVLTYGTGALNIDGSRVGKSKPAATNTAFNSWRNLENRTDRQTPEQTYNQNQGRWPANVIHDGSDEVLAGFPETAPSRQGKPRGTAKKGLFANSEFNKVGTEHNDSGSAARFFYCAKASKSERNAGLEGLPERRESDRERDDGVGEDNPRNRTNEAKRNFHPTVKPLALMRYLVKLVTPPNGIVLDPFLGSGTTAVAAILERFEWIGCEMTEDYFPIIEARVAWAQNEKEGKLL